MKRVKLVLAYDGTNYCGWQLQPNGKTVEAVLNKALSELLKEDIQVIGASRTDSGVHALGNVAVFDTNSRIPADKISFALNQRLPDDIAIQESYEVKSDYHPRKCNTTKTYEYKILNRKMPIPSFRLNSYFHYMPLDVEKMKEAAKYLVGEHDFKSFCSTRTQVEDTVRTIYSLDIRKDSDMISIRISGNGFLYNMVRIIVGTLLRVGTGYYEPAHVIEIIDGRDRALAGPKVPAHGLTLISIVEEKLKPLISVENKYVKYRVIQKDIEVSGNSYIIVDFCVEGDYTSLLLRLTKQATRNGANVVYIQDKTGRLVDGDQIGYYTFKKVCDTGCLNPSILDEYGSFIPSTSWFSTYDPMCHKENTETNPSE
ncbi:MAG: tRNA pseudouridine(38-40) synthase TruA [Lachnospiraceae bacterium]